ncbi:MAG: amidohydrolase family protein [Armatimonas sp.]
MVHRALQALQPVVEQKLPLIARASNSNEISRTLRLGKEFRLTPVIDGGTESWAQVSALKAAGVSVLLSAALPEAPKREPGEPVRDSLTVLRKRALAPTSAAALAKAGVPFALTTSGLASPADLSKNVRKMIAAGLTEEQAIAALTQTPAKLLGVDRQLGTLAPGKLGYVLAIEGGSLFGPKAKPRFLFIDGKRFSLSGPSAAAGAKPSVLPQLPPGISKEQALAFLKANPEQAAGFLPPGVTVAQAIAELEGKNTPQDKPTTDKPAEDEKIAPPPAVTPGPLFPVPASVGDAYVLRGATIWPGDGKPFVGDLYIQGGKIAGVGAKLSVPAGTKEINAQGKHIAPGIIDCHSHSAVDGSVNEGSNIVTAECRIADVLDPFDVSIYRQLAGGVTAANVLHGSANAIGGQNAVVKWRWGVSEPTELIYVNAPQGVKFALGENPTGSNSGGGGRRGARYPSSRLGVERVIRSKFTEARDYARKRKAGIPVRQDFQLDAIVEVLEGKRLVHCHSYRADEILMMVRLADEFGFRIGTFQHVLEGYKVANELAAHGAGGSTFSDWWAYKIEAYDAIPQNAALMTQRGIVSSINSDDDEQARRLNNEAAKSMRYGLSDVEALAMVTINPAKQLKIDKYTGSLTVGKDADFAVWSDSPLSSQSVCEKTFVEGVLRFDKEADKAARIANEAEKTRLLTALEPPKKDEKKPGDPVVPAPEKFTLAEQGELQQMPRNELPAARSCW